MLERVRRDLRLGAAVGPQRAFGSTSLKTNGKIFAMLVKGRLVVKLDRKRVDELVAAGRGRGRSIPATAEFRRSGSRSRPTSDDAWLSSAPRSPRHSWLRRESAPLEAGPGSRQVSAEIDQCARCER